MKVREVERIPVGSAHLCPEGAWDSGTEWRYNPYTVLMLLFENMGLTDPVDSNWGVF